MFWTTPRGRHVSSAALCFAVAASLLPAGAQTSAAAMPAGTPRSWIEDAATHELRIIDSEGLTPLRYKVRKVDNKGDVTRETIETRDGSVARLIERNGQPLTEAEDAAERKRLEGILADPGQVAKHHKRDASTRDDTMALVKLMPSAMIFTYAPGQPQPAGASGTQIVLDFAPDPKFKPPTMASELLTGLAGRMWVDAKTQRLTRVEGHVLKPVSFGWGIVGKIYPGGTIELEQTNAGGERWVYSNLAMHLQMRVIVKTLAMNDRMTASDFRPLPAPMSVEEAVKALLAMPVKVSAAR